MVYNFLTMKKSYREFFGSYPHKPIPNFYGPEGQAGTITIDAEPFGRHNLLFYHCRVGRAALPDHGTPILTPQQHGLVAHLESQFHDPIPPTKNELLQLTYQLDFAPELISKVVSFFNVC